MVFFRYIFNLRVLLIVIFNCDYLGWFCIINLIFLVGNSIKLLIGYLEFMVFCLLFKLVFEMLVKVYIGKQVCIDKIDMEDGLI